MRTVSDITAATRERSGIAEERDGLVWAAILEAIPGPAVAINLQGETLSANKIFRAALDTAGLSDLLWGEQTGPFLHDLFDPLTARRCQHALATAEAGRAVDVDGGVYWKDGARFCDTVSFSLGLKDQDKTPFVLVQFKGIAAKAHSVGLSAALMVKHFPDDCLLLEPERGPQICAEELTAVAGCTISADELETALQALETNLSAVIYGHPLSDGHKGDLYPLATEIRFSGVEDAGTDQKVVLAVIRRGVECPRTAEENRRLAYADPLTGLPNRRAFLKSLEHHLGILRAGDAQSLAIFCVDLDNFKRINDLGGHAAGDEMLQLVSANLQHVLQGNGTIARMGGDEFAAIRFVNSVDEAKSLAAQMCESLDGIRLACDERVFFVGGSIGICYCDADAVSEQADPRDMLHEADLASMNAKRQRGSVYNLRIASEETFTSRSAPAVAHGGEMHQSVPINALELQMAPVVELGSSRVVGREALVSIKGDDTEPMSPRGLLASTERNGFMSNIDSWALDRSLQMAMHLPRAQWLSVGVSIDAFADPLVRSLLDSQLRMNPLLAGRLCVVVSERDFIREPMAAKGFLKYVVELGCQAQVDDFSGNWSVLESLTDLQVDWVKLDPASIASARKNTARQRILAAMIEACADIGIKTIAKGIEQKAQLELLQDLGVFAAKGRYFGPLEKA